MDKDYFMNAGIPPPQPLHLESSMPIPWSRDQSFFNPDSTMDHHFSQFDSTWTSMLSSTTTTATAPATAAAASSNDAFILRELIGKLGDTAAAIPFPDNDRSSSSPKLRLPILDQINLPNLGSTAALVTPPLSALSADPGFAERAAKFSRFGSRSFNGRTSQVGGGSNPPSMAAEENLPRVSSTPSLKQNGSPLQAINGGVPVNSDKKFRTNSNEESSVSDQIASGETASMNSRKRKAISKGKNSPKRVERDDNGNLKKSKPSENGENETKTEGQNDENKPTQKRPESPKDYIHVRARRGQATDSHSLAERVRREKISERMKLLQDLVPGCNKVTGKALMLDEIINYVQSLQRQVEFLSMKLASVNPALEFNVENFISKDMFQQNTTLAPQMYPLDSSAPAYYLHQNVQQQQQLPSTYITSVDPLPFDGFNENLPQFPALNEDDLQSIVQMGFLQKSANFSVQNHTSNMKVEL